MVKINLDQTTKMIRDKVANVVKPDDHQIVQIINEKFPMNGIKANAETQEKDFPQAVKALGFDGCVQNHKGIVFKTPLPQKVKHAIVDHLDLSDHQSFTKPIILAVIAIALIIITLAMGFGSYMGAVLVSFVAIGISIHLIHVVDAMGDLDKRNDNLLVHLSNYYKDVADVKQQVKHSLPTVNLTYKDRKQARASQNTREMMAQATPVWTANTPPRTIPDTDDDHFWRDMFWMDQINDAINDHHDDHNWSSNDNNDWSSNDDNDWGSDDDDHDDHDDWGDGGGSDWGGGFFDGGGGSDWGGGGDFGGSDW